MPREDVRRDKKNRVLWHGEAQRPDGKYVFKYWVEGKQKTLASWRLVPEDYQPPGTKPTLSLREMEKNIGRDMESIIDPLRMKMTVKECVERYIKTKVGVKTSTKSNYQTIMNSLKKQPFYYRKIHEIRTSDAKLFLIKLQQEDGMHWSKIKSIRGVLRPAFQMAVDDDILMKNPFQFELVGVLVNDSVMREAITKEQMNKFLKFVHDDNVYCKYYEAVYILFHTGMRISEFCGLTIKDLDMENRIINIDHQLLRDSKMNSYIQTTKTNAGTRKLPMSEDVYQCFKAILEDREAPAVEKMIDGYSGFLYLDKEGLPLVAMHWEHRLQSMVGRYNAIYRVQMPKITPHVCRHTYCSNMARARMNPKTLQYLMGHSDISVTLNVYTHLGLDDAKDEMLRLKEMEDAKKEIERMNGDTSQMQFRVV